MIEHTTLTYTISLRTGEKNVYHIIWCNDLGQIIGEDIFKGTSSEAFDRAELKIKYLNRKLESYLESSNRTVRTPITE